MSTADRVDVHAHLVPPFWGESLHDHGGDPAGWSLPQWSADAHLKFMDDNGIATSLLSLTAPSVVGWQGHERREMARRVNEYVATLSSTHPGRFGNFATVPLPDVDGAVIEAEYALDSLGAEGVVLLSNYGGEYLGSTYYTALWESLNARSAVVFIHPGHPMIPILSDVPGPIVDYPFDTTRNAVHMVFNGVLDRYPAVRIILSHAGGFVPFAVGRFCELRHALDVSGPSPNELLDKFKQFYWDTALSSGHAAFGSLLELADHSRILFGSDFPYAPTSVASRFTEILDKDTGLSSDLLRAINIGNVRELLPHPTPHR